MGLAADCLLLRRLRKREHMQGMRDRKHIQEYGGRYGKAAFPINPGVRQPPGFAPAKRMIEQTA